MPPSVSVILPVFNAASTIEEALQSVLEQDADVELIVVAGPSTDGSDEIIDKYRNSIDQVILDEGKGVYAAMNAGVKASRSEYLYFLGGDDRIQSANAISGLLSVVPPGGIAYGSIAYIGDIPGGVPAVHHSTFGNGLYWRNTLHHQSCIYPSAFLREYPFDENLRVLADYKVNLQLLNAGISYAETDLVVAECRASGLSKRFAGSLYKEELQVKKELLPAWAYALNQVWVWMKYAYKRQAGSSKGV